MEAGRRKQMWILGAAAALAAIGAYFAYRSREPRPVAAAPVEPPVPAPPSMIAEAVAGTPDATWRKAQTAIGGVVLLAPPTFGGVLGAIARVPALSILVDGGSPAYGVVGGGGAWVIAAHVVSAQRARGTLEGDPQSGGLAVAGHAGTIDLMQAQGAWLGLAGGWVLVGSDRAAVESLGPYAYRTLPTRPLPAAAIAASMNHDALAGPIREALQRRWADLDHFLLAKDEEQRSLHGGRAPDLAEPKAVVAELDAIEKTYETRVAGMERADATVDVDEDGVHARVTLTAPRDGEVASWVDALEGGSSAPLASSAEDALATFFWRSDQDDRARAAKETTQTLEQALGSRVPPGDVAKLGEILERVGGERGGWALASVSGGPQTGGLLRLATNDPNGVGASVGDAVDLLRKPGWAKWEADALGVTQIDRAGTHATISTATGTLQASWAARGGELDLAVGVDAASVLAAGSAQVTLGSDAKVSSWLREIRSSVVWALVARPLMLSSSPRGDPLLVALTHGPRAAVLDARAPGAVIRELIVASSKGL